MFRRIEGLATRAGVVLSLALTVSVAINLMALQPPPPGRRGAQEAQAPWFEPTSGRNLVATPVALNSLQPTTQQSDADIVRGVQRELNARNYDAGLPDGVAGLVTRAAVMAYEHDYNLALTATPSEALLSRIVLGSSAPQTATRGGGQASTEAASVIRMVKQSLAGLGYQPGRLDGVLTPEAQRAIREFEADQKLAETGRISAPLMSRLLRLQGQGPVVKPQPRSAAGKPASSKAPTARSAQR